ncbi:GNAT family N-acetyltransferase [Terrarubrum flagellatum]|uniref:GNAT family N-acetyltransferase n=1 Tax=Terrirubrum flagellatum TaxID=2895980 RepID=UPI0031454562
MSINLRIATVDDLDALARLNEPVQQLHARLYPADFKASPERAEVKTFFAARLADPKSTIALAEVDRRPAGYIWFDSVMRLESAFKPERRCFYIHQISVDPEFRRRGVGAALMRCVVDEATSLGIPDIELDTWAANQEAHRFFEAQGFATLKLVYKRRAESR